MQDLGKDRIVVVTTFFTECAAICPVTGQKFAQLAKLLGRRLGRDVVLVSVSVDPDNHTPTEMREWNKLIEELTLAKPDKAGSIGMAAGGGRK